VGATPRTEEGVVKNNIVDIKPGMPELREMMKDPKGYFRRLAMEWREQALMAHYRAQNEPDPFVAEELRELAWGLESVAKDMLALSRKKGPWKWKVPTGVEK
jgi:hypothetical protein